MYGLFGLAFENKGGLGYQTSHESPASTGGGSVQQSLAKSFFAAYNAFVRIEYISH